MTVSRKALLRGTAADPGMSEHSNIRRTKRATARMIVVHRVGVLLIPKVGAKRNRIAASACPGMNNAPCRVLDHRKMLVSRCAALVEDPIRRFLVNGLRRCRRNLRKHVAESSLRPAARHRLRRQFRLRRLGSCKQPLIRFLLISRRQQRAAPSLIPRRPRLYGTRTHAGHDSLREIVSDGRFWCARSGFRAPWSK